VLRAPADGIVSVIFAEVGENIHAGQPVLVIEVSGKQWLSFNAREGRCHENRRTKPRRERRVR
jgi:HlyD family secretion protein